MKSETYRGVRLRVQKGRDWGHLTWIVNGEPWGDWRGTDEQAAIDQMKRYVDTAAEQPQAYPRFAPPARVSGTTPEDQP